MLIASRLALQMPIGPGVAVYCRNSLVSSLMSSMAARPPTVRDLADQCRTGRFLEPGLERVTAPVLAV